MNANTKAPQFYVADPATRTRALVTTTKRPRVARVFVPAEELPPGLSGRVLAALSRAQLDVQVG